MIGSLLVLVVGFILFSYISVFYLPVISKKQEREGVELARKKLKWLSSKILKTLSVELEIIYKNKESIAKLDKSMGIVFVSNHQSNFDIPVLVVSLCQDIGFVAKKEMSNWLFFSIWMKKSKCVFLDRKNPRQGIKDMKKAVEIVKDGYPIVIFPEGERSKTGKIGNFKKGSFKLATDISGVIVPVTLKGTYDIQKTGDWKIYRKRKVTIVVDEPIFVETLSQEEYKNISENVKRKIEENFN